jgi:CRISPR-associated protein Cas5t
MTATCLAALEVTVTAAVVSFRNPLYAGVQVGLPCPPPATVGGLLAAAVGGWQHVDSGLRFAMAFHARGAGVDLETYHPLDASGQKTSPTPRNREFLADVELTIWLMDEIDQWYRALRRPVWPMRLGRSQDLVGISLRKVSLHLAAGAQRRAVVAEAPGAAGTLLRLPTSVALGRDRTRWDSYRFDITGRSESLVPDTWSTDDGQAVAVLPAIHPVSAFRT